MEIVSRPDLRSSDQAKAYLTKLRTILRYLGTCDGNMEEGSLRADINVSVRKPGAPFGTRCEIKNVNSIRFIGQAIDYEARRQIEVLEDGGIDRPGDAAVRCADAARRGRCAPRKRRTTTAISPIPIFCRSSSRRITWTGSPRTSRSFRMQKRARFIKSFGLSAYDADVLVAEREAADYFEDCSQGARAEAGRELGDQRIVWPPQQGRQEHHRELRSRRSVLAPCSI